MLWPIDWPATTDTDALDPAVKERAEKLAGSTLYMLTLQRVGGVHITVMPERFRRLRGLYIWDLDLTGALIGTFYPGTIYPGQLEREVRRLEVDAVVLEGPVGQIDSISIDGVPFTGDYRVEDGNKLVRMDGDSWPLESGDKFTVTYLKGYPVDSLGRYMGGLLAEEFVKLLTSAKNCRLPKGTTNIQRQGINIQVSTGMFPDNRVGIEEVDTYIHMWNPNGLKVKPAVYSPDKPKFRQTSWLPS
jgi:hypothetical protein